MRNKLWVQVCIWFEALNIYVTLVDKKIPPFRVVFVFVFSRELDLYIYTQSNL